MDHRIATVARFTLLEAWRTRLPLLTAGTVVCLLLASFFVREIAIAESHRFQTAFYAAAVRFATVLIVALHVIASVGRDFQDKGLEATLALDLPRSSYIAGKLAGFVIVAALTAAAAGIVLVPLAGLEATAQWSLSLAVELGVVVALALFAIMSFGAVTPASLLVAAAYILARSLSAIQLISLHPIANAEALSNQVMSGVVKALALVVPPIDQWTRTEWLVDTSAPWLSLGWIAVHGGIVVVLLGAAAVFDMHRRTL